MPKLFLRTTTALSVVLLLNPAAAQSVRGITFIQSAAASGELSCEVDVDGAPVIGGGVMLDGEVALDATGAAIVCDEAIAAGGVMAEPNTVVEDGLPTDEAPTEAVVAPVEEAPTEEVATPVEETPAENAPTEELAEEPEVVTPTEEVAEEPVTDAPAEETAEEQPDTEPAQELVEEPAEAPASDEVAEEPVDPVEPAAESEVAEEPVEPAESDVVQDAPVETDTETAVETEVQVEEAPAETATDTPATDETTEPAVVDADNADLEDTGAKVVEAEEEPAKPPAAAAAAAADTEEPAEGATVEVETITEDNSRSSDEDVAAASANDGDDDDNRRLLKILGAAGAAIAIGQLLDNGDEVVETTGDRVVVQRNGQYVVRKDENELLRRPGSVVRTEEFADGSSRTIVEREDGSRVITIRDQDGYTVRRSRVLADGQEVLLFDDTAQPAEVQIDVTELPEPQPEEGQVICYVDGDVEALIAALRQANEIDLQRSYSLRQIREFEPLRAALPRVDLDAITFTTGSAAITSSQVRNLDTLGRVIQQMIEEDPREVFLVEGHTDAVGSEVSNLALSDQRAESVALALTEYYDVPPENLVVQGYGEQFLKVVTEQAERANRRATVRRITPLLESASR